MPRNGQGIYTLPPVYQAVTGEKIEAQQHNVPFEDVASDLNFPRPITAGGTGGASASQARENLGVYSKAETDGKITGMPSGAPEKQTLADGDGVLISDSADGGKPKRLLWSRLKILLNSLYLPLTGGTITGNIITLGRYVLKNAGDRVLNFQNSDGTTVGDIWSESANYNIHVRAQNARYTFGSDSTFTAPGRVATSGGVTVAAPNRGGVRIETGDTNDPRAGHVAFYAPDGTRVAYIGYGNTANPNRIVYVPSGSYTGHEFLGDVVLRTGPLYVGNPGGAIIGSNGNISGSIWQNWGSGNAFDAVNNRIESRGASYRDAAIAQIMPTIAAQAYNAVGSYVFARIANRAGVNPGTVVAGSELYPANARGSNYATALPGTYRCMGWAEAYENEGDRGTTLWMRVG
ncbi:hypothetical protein [Brucella sp. IR073]|uniref:hypothetical protein n=1 Tax=unclassified Brucella TaxID=2632610 RepID=UPI003B986BF5